MNMDNIFLQLLALAKFIEILMTSLIFECYILQADAMTTIVSEQR